MEARILAKTRQRPPDGSTHWSTRKLAKVLGVSHVLVARVWRRAGLQPHRLERYMLSDDPDFEQKAADVIGLYLNPPQHAVVFAADEKTAIQALDRLDPVLPLSPGRAERHGFEYYRHGTLSLYAALNTTHRRNHRADGAAAYQRGLRRLLGGRPGDTTASTRDPCDYRQPRRAQDQTRPGVSRRRIRGSTCTSRRPTRRGSIKSNSGLPRSSATCSRVASSRRFQTSPARSGGTSRATTRTQNRSVGPTAIQRIELLLVQLIQSTSDRRS